MSELAAISQIAPPYQLTATRHGAMLVNPNDIYMGQSFLRYGECCEHEIQTLLQFLMHPQRLSGLVIEVGSNMGVHTIPLARTLAAQNRTMLAFEPQPIIFQQLCANLALNGLMNVIARPYACAAQPGTVSFDPPDYHSLGNFGGTAMNSAAPTAQVVPCYPLDAFVQDAPVALIKIDVEGHELRVLQGAQGILARSHPILYVENDRVDQSPALIESLLAQGYRLWWHITRAFNPANFLQNPRNIYGDVSLMNMLCLHPCHGITLDGLPEITDPVAHPLAHPLPHPDLPVIPGAADAAQMAEPGGTPCAMQH
jgi:FkbM family methyltransferase